MIPTIAAIVVDNMAGIIIAAGFLEPAEARIEMIVEGTS